MPEALVVSSRSSESVVLQWLALALTPRLGPTRARRLVEHFGGVQNVFKASLTELEACGIQTVSAQSLGTGQSMELAHDEMGRVSASEVSVVCMDDSSYPAQLKQIYDPRWSFMSGEMWTQSLSRESRWLELAIPRPTGRAWRNGWHAISPARGLVIFSGMARGVDTAAHRGAIAAKGKTVAVLGTGVDVIYPKENTRLAEQMLAIGGAVISEFPMGTFPAPQNFPIRNRIISGISHGSSGGRSRGIQRHPHHRPLRAGAESRGLRRARQRHQQKFLGTQTP